MTIYFNYLKFFKQFIVYSLLFVLIFSCNTTDKGSYSSIENNDIIATFSGSKSCKSCHEDEFENGKDLTMTSL